MNGEVVETGKATERARSYVDIIIDTVRQPLAAMKTRSESSASIPRSRSIWKCPLRRRGHVERLHDRLRHFGGSPHLPGTSGCLPGQEQARLFIWRLAYKLPCVQLFSALLSLLTSEELSPTLRQSRSHCAVCDSSVPKIQNRERKPTMSNEKAAKSAHDPLGNEIASRHRVDFDATVTALAQTAKDMNSKYKETSEAGLALSVVLC